MNTQKSSKKGMWIVLGIVVLAAAAYFFYQGQSAPSTGLLESSGTTDVSAQVIGLLSQIQGLKIDKSLFSDPAYQTLRDYTVIIPPQPVGRSNPFAPIPGVVNHSAGKTATGH